MRRGLPPESVIRRAVRAGDKRQQRRDERRAREGVHGGSLELGAGCQRDDASGKIVNRFDQRRNELVVAQRLRAVGVVLVRQHPPAKVIDAGLCGAQGHGQTTFKTLPAALSIQSFPDVSPVELVGKPRIDPGPRDA